MKKAISIFISIILLATTILSGSLSAFAENTTKYWEPRPNCQDTIACVNDKEYSDDIKISYNNDSEQFTISYNGKGVVINWEILGKYLEKSFVFSFFRRGVELQKVLK